MTDDSLFASAVATAAVGLAVVTSLGLAARGILPLDAAYPAKAAALFVVVMLAAIVRVRAHHPFRQFGPANQVTTVRVVLLALVAGLIGEPMLSPDATGAVAASATAAGLGVVLLDGVDGWLARRTRMSSAFGARFDMETDALLILTLAILAWQFGKAGPWVIASGLLRYLFVAAGLAFAWMRRELPPTRRGRVICVVQIVTLSLALVPRIAPPASSLLAAGGLLALCYSFFVDTIWLWRQRPH